LKYIDKFLVDEFAPMSFEKKIFHHHSLFDSIHPNIQNMPYRIYQMPKKTVLSARPYGQIFSLNTYDWFKNWFSFEGVIRLLIILCPEKDRQGVRHFCADIESRTILLSFRTRPKRKGNVNDPLRERNHNILNELIPGCPESRRSNSVASDENFQGWNVHFLVFCKIWSQNNDRIDYGRQRELKHQFWCHASATSSPNSSISMYVSE
jgi:hypothetical protein